MNDAHLFKAARDCSKNADYSGGGKAKIGCVAVYKGTILAKGWNTDKTHSEQAYYNQWRYKDSANNYLPDKLHAEMSVLNRIKYLDIDFSKLHLYVYREYRNGSLAPSRPCPSCLAAIKQLGIRNVHYTTLDGYCTEKLLKNKAD